MVLYARKDATAFLWMDHWSSANTCIDHFSSWRIDLLGYMSEDQGKKLLFSGIDRSSLSGKDSQINWSKPSLNVLREDVKNNKTLYLYIRDTVSLKQTTRMLLCMLPIVSDFEL